MLLSLRQSAASLPREPRDTLFLLAVIGWIVLLQSFHLPVWCSALAAGVLVWRGTLAWHSRPLPGWHWRLLLLVSALGATWFQYKTLLGQDAGVTLIVVLLALKTLELQARRDAFVIFFLGFFTLLTHFFHSQSLLTAAGILLALLGLLTALVNAHMPVGRPPLWHAARLAAGMALLGAPIMVVLFMLFPRFAPLWGVPGDTMGGRTGLSGQMVVGQIARLALDNSIAFRVTFNGPPPHPSELYFRGPVFSRFDGREWRPAYPGQRGMASAELAVEGEPLSYQVTMEPSNRPWLPTLELTTQAPALPAGQSALTTPDLQWLAGRPITEITRYSAQSHLRFRHGPLQRTLALQSDLELPSGFNPRTLQWAQDLRRQTGENPVALIDAALAQLRTGGYRYTLEPGVYGQHTADEFWFDRKAGFCEHIASSFVVLMRALDIPARVVTGYQGGERNPVDGYWTVRQSDAHAWAEVWLEGRGWQRIDPTSHVMPDRTQALQRLALDPGPIAGAILRLNPSLLAQIRQMWEATNNRWNQWVLNYTQSDQLDLLKKLGLRSASWHDLAYVLLATLVLVSLVGALWAWWERQTRDPWQRLLLQARSRLLAAGIDLPAQATPRQMAQAVKSNGTGADLAALEQWLMLLEAQRYDPHNRLSLQKLRAEMARLPWPRPGARTG